MSVIIVAEGGINASGDIQTALEMCDAALAAGVDYIKWQCRSPRLDVPREMWDMRRSTPWGEMSYIEYKERLEWSEADWNAIDAYCKEIGLKWFASAWSIPAAEFLLSYGPDYIKVPSAKLTDHSLLRFLVREQSKSLGALTILSTGMSTMAEVDEAVDQLLPDVLMACTSTYPCPVEELNLRCITTYQERFPGIQIGYSGHETGLATTVAAVALGATMVERHLTLDRSSFGTDQAASVEPQGFARLVHDIRNVELALGDGEKRVYPSEEPIKAKLRGVHDGIENTPRES